MSILSIAYSGINAFKRALDVTANNTVNAGTKGYVRQSVAFTSTGSTRYGNAFIGNGVTIGRVFRNVDQFANTQVRNSNSLKSQYDTFYQQALQIDQLLSDDGSSLSNAMQTFFSAFGQLNNSPDSPATRNVAYVASQALVNQFNLMQGRLDEYQHNSSSQIAEVVNQINQYTTSLADLNQQILLNQDAPDLLDKRDTILEELSKLVDVQVVDQQDGTLNVMLSSGESLVTGGNVRTLGMNTNQKMNTGTQIVFVTATGQIDITKKVHSGMLGGLLDYENNVIGKSSQLIGQIAIGLAQKFNAQHILGMDMNNQIGKAFFNDFNSSTSQLSRSISSTYNTGTAALSVAISDISQIKSSDYDLVVSDTSLNEVRIISKADGKSTTLNWSSNPPAPPAGQITFEGMTITVDNIANLANKDQFALVPTRQAARDLSLAINGGSEIAMAAPVKVLSSLNNMGNGQIALGTMFNTSGVNKQYRIDFVSGTQYNVVNVTDNTTSGPFAFTPNSNNTVQIPDSLTPSYSVVLSGAPSIGDQFTTDFNAGGYGDNRNGALLLNLQQSKFFSGGQEGLFDRYGALLTQVGSQTHQAEVNALSAGVINANAVDMQQSISGVDVDEEAANVIKLQQAFQAAGKLVEVANQMMNSIFELLR